MASNLACVGLAAACQAELSALVDAVLPSAVRLGQGAGVELLRWEDPSGARLVFVVDDGQVVSFLPSFASAASTRLAHVNRLNADVAIAAVVDDEGEQLTSVAFELEQIRLLPDHPVKSALAGVSFLGTRISVHLDSEAFGRSPESLLDPNADPDEPPPAHYVERGFKWPPRVGEESFFSYGVFGDPSQAKAHGRFSGVVLHAERRTVRQTGQSFIVAKVQTVGIEANVCLSGLEFEGVPEPGQIIAGDVFIVGSMPELEPSSPTRRWWQRARS